MFIVGFKRVMSIYGVTRRAFRFFRLFHYGVRYENMRMRNPGMSKFRFRKVLRRNCICGSGVGVVILAEYRKHAAGVGVPAETLHLQ
jgi:hypothetical protein